MDSYLFDGLSEEQITKVKECKSQDEILRLAKDEDVELTEEQLEAIHGGNCGSSKNKIKIP